MRGHNARQIRSSPLCDLCHICISEYSYSFSRTCRFGGGRQPPGADWRAVRGTCDVRRGKKLNDIFSIAGAAYRALTARKDGPSLYDVCDPLLLTATEAATRISASSTGPRSAIRRCGRCCAGPGCRSCATKARLASAARGADPGARRRNAGLGRDRQAGRGAAGYHRAAASPAGPVAAPARAPETRARSSA